MRHLGIIIAAAAAATTATTTRAAATTLQTAHGQQLRQGLTGSSLMVKHAGFKNQLRSHVQHSKRSVHNPSDCRSGRPQTQADI